MTNNDTNGPPLVTGTPGEMLQQLSADVPWEGGADPVVWFDLAQLLDGVPELLALTEGDRRAAVAVLLVEIFWRDGDCLDNVRRRAVQVLTPEGGEPLNSPGAVSNALAATADAMELGPVGERDPRGPAARTWGCLKDLGRPRPCNAAARALVVPRVAPAKHRDCKSRAQPDRLLGRVALAALGQPAELLDERDDPIATARGQLGKVSGAPVGASLGAGFHATFQAWTSR